LGSPNFILNCFDLFGYSHNLSLTFQLLCCVIQKDLLEKKTFAVDIDGTITLNGMGTIHLEALSKLRSLKDDGHNVVFVTGDLLLKDIYFQYLVD